MHSSGSGPALRALAHRDRVAALADAGSVEWLDDPRASPHLSRFGVAPQQDDGIALARIRIDGAPLFVAAQDERFLRGSVGALQGGALRSLCDRARVERPAGVLILAASGGVRLHEANAAELALAQALRALFDLRGAGVPCIALAVGDVFGGMSIVACATDRLAALPHVRIGVSGPAVIESVRGRGELDSSDRSSVDAIFGAAARVALGAVDPVDDSTTALRAWIARAVQNTCAFADDVAARQRDLARRLDETTSSAAQRELSSGLPALRLFDSVAAIEANLYRAPKAFLLAPLGGLSLGAAQSHAMDHALLAHVAQDGQPPLPLCIVEDCAGHEASVRAERLFLSQYLAQHAAVLALLRQRGHRLVGLLAGTGHSAAFFVNALQADVLYALPDARVEAMAPSAIERVTGVAAASLVENDPLLGHPVRHFASLGGVRAIVDDPTLDDLLK
ncbi:MAG TPA: biotin-independent malonate decarboxylase subunit gamma [Casimicrobiaceae bacterium]|nr:biotin-independent malonate decarboxylase subunit gamma [Casimicrobiaceae bacterium]